MDERRKGKRPKLRTPYYTSEDSEGIPFTIVSMEEKAVAEYCGIPIFQVYEMDVFTYWTLLHDVVVYNHSQTKKGREWLKNAYRLTCTEPDRDKLHQKTKRGGRMNNGRR